MNEAATQQYEAMTGKTTAAPTGTVLPNVDNGDDDENLVKTQTGYLSVATKTSSSSSNNTSTSTKTTTKKKDVETMYRMVALDLDGTLLSNDRQIAAEQVEYLRRLQSNGFTVCIATGRAPTGVYDHVMKLGIHNLPVVCSNGARGFYCSPLPPNTSLDAAASLLPPPPGQVTTEKLFYDPVPKRIVERTIQLANRLGYAIQYYTEDDCVYANQKNPIHYKMTQQYTDYTGVRIDHVDDDFQSLLSDGPDQQLPSKLLVLFDEKNPDVARRHFTNEFVTSEGEEEATVVKGYCTWFLEVLSSSVNKGQGLKQMCLVLNIPLEEVVAIGDGCNDIEFLEMAGLGVAVANAEPEVKDCADFVSEYTNNQHGVMKVLQDLDEQNRLQITL